jgi:hypothetical protein
VFANLIILIAVACLMPMTQALSSRRQSGIKKPRWWITPASISAGFFVIFAMAIPKLDDVLSTFQKVDAIQDEFTKASQQLKIATDQLKTAADPKQLADLNSQLSDAESRIKEADHARQRAEELLARLQSPAGELLTRLQSPAGGHGIDPVAPVEKSPTPIFWQTAIVSALHDRQLSNCVSDFLKSHPSLFHMPFSECTSEPSSSCIMASAVTAAKEGRSEFAQPIAMVALCGNSEAGKAVLDAGPDRVGSFLSSLEAPLNQRSGLVHRKADQKVNS